MDTINITIRPTAVESGLLDSVNYRPRLDPILSYSGEVLSRFLDGDERAPVIEKRGFGIRGKKEDVVKTAKVMCMEVEEVFRLR